MTTFHIGERVVVMVRSWSSSSKLGTITEIFPKRLFRISLDVGEVLKKDLDLVEIGERYNLLDPDDIMSRGDDVFLGSHWEAVNGWLNRTVHNAIVRRPK